MIFSAIRPQTPFASILPASVRRPMRESLPRENQSRAAAPPDARPNSEFRRTEKSDSRPASVATLAPRMRLRLCRHCAALVQQRTLSDSRSLLLLLLFETNYFFHQRFETRLATERIEQRINL